MTADAQSIAVALSKRAQRIPGGGFLVPCPVASHGKGRGDRSPSLRISDGKTRLLVHCFSGCDSRDVLDELRRRGLLDGVNQPVRSSTITAHKAPARDDYARKQHRKAAWLWSHRQPITGSIAERYLRERKITCPLPQTLGFLPPTKPEHHPAMIAAFAMPDEIEPGKLAEPRDVRAVHLTLLKPDGTGKAELPDGKSPKIMIGSSSLPIVLAPPSDSLGLAITEGIEDALTAHQATGVGAWAAGSASRMPALADVIPQYIESVTIFAHNDVAGRNGARGLAKALRDRDIEVALQGIRS
jgi:hypothetical protein